ncbi:MAG TPA: response regulator transcription factor [Gemmatimonadales bacterium]|jgi:DNA-binding NarL/FixJ family response regulator/tetratricopeptide (TPR) repeat protein
MVSSALDRGRQAFGRAAWAESYAQLSSADDERALDAEDVVRLATAAQLLGKDADSAELWARAHQEFLARGDPERAVRCAFRLAVPLLFKGEVARASGWISRGRRLLDEGQHDCVEQGYLLFPLALQAILQGDDQTAYDTFGKAAAFGERFHDVDLVTLGRHGQGRALLRLGQLAGGVALLDEVMIAVTAGEVSPIVAGDVYCSVIEACHEIYDLRRAQEWTDAMARWCASQPDQLSYRGSCLIRRAEIMRLHGAWSDAMEIAEQAREWFSRPPVHRAVGAAFYQLADLYRLRGESDKAIEAYREASHWGREPQPGLALVRLEEGQVEAARNAIGRAAGETRGRQQRAQLLPAYVEIMLAANDVAGARAGADELARIAAGVGAPLLQALASHAQGAVLLAEGQAGAALSALRQALSAWRAIEAPYEAARVRMLVGLACRALGDDDAAEMELEAAAQTFERLGAAPDLARTRQLSHRNEAAAGGLTARELEVLELVATGKSNRSIASELAISEKTVARHMSNIFTKLGISSRAAATAYAFRNKLA